MIVSVAGSETAAAWCHLVFPHTFSDEPPNVQTHSQVAILQSASHDYLTKL